MGKAVKNSGGSIIYDGESHAIIHKLVGVSTGTDRELVAATTGQKVVVVSIAFSCVAAGACTIVFNTKPAGAGTAISCQFNVAANSTVVLPRNEDGWFETNSGEGLSCTLGTNNAGVQINYILV